ncbi:TrkH family potassium uptake protein [Azospirillum picis]|uniref:Trk system potassium uptake protein n=1 Tax=Azospirillum picis TaxID=488438 RepID=A0ABU0MJK1_9PROT|nr:TrkH family potassium uptake protein [Azospirillum picis]MBP2299827.1 trk system potassium uptake protein TrkH [Azospirillum picis]MDQ0533623.1 trk system potassium uptake protein TrkH [Azospirillum picis]
MPNLRPILFIVAIVLLALAATMLIPAGVDYAYGNPDSGIFLSSAAFTGVCGATLALATRCHLTGGLTLRQAFLLTPLTWTTTAAFAALPFQFGHFPELSLNYANAYFETMSGLTTTGSTVLVGLDLTTEGILLWRALLQWLGGIGIIGVAIAVLPALRVGGMQLFRTESSDRSEKVLPRAQQIAKAIVAVYIGLTAVCGLSYWAAGMTPFEAIVHALTSLSTGGFSTSDHSIGSFDNPALHWLVTLFMLLGSLPFVLYVRTLTGQRDALWRDNQVRSYLGFLAAVILPLSVWLAASNHFDYLDALRMAAFNVVSVVTTTGYAYTDYSQWGNLAVGVFFGLTFIGGCTGSTTGGIKIFRFEVLVIVLRTHFRHLIYPRGVFPRRYGARRIDDDVLGSVIVFFALFFTAYSLLTIALMALGLDFITSASAAVAALANVGPGLGDTIGPAGTYAAVPDSAKWLLSLAMLMGRLELFTVLVLFMPQFWRG